VRRAVPRTLAIAAALCLLVPALAGPASAARRFSPGPQHVQRSTTRWGHGGRSHGGHAFRGRPDFRGRHHGHGGHPFRDGRRFHGGRHHGHGHVKGGVVLGFGFGALATAPWWAFPRPTYVYPAPAYAYPAYPAPAYPAYPAYAPYAVPAAPAGPPVAPPGDPAAVPPGSPTPLPPTPEPLSPAPGPPPGASAAGSATGGAQPAGPPAVSGGDAAPPADPASSCETVTVVGHWETRIYPDGQRMTVWVPTATRSVCR
jgi:hypothetical protein